MSDLLTVLEGVVYRPVARFFERSAGGPSHGFSTPFVFTSPERDLGFSAVRWGEVVYRRCRDIAELFHSLISGLEGRTFSARRLPKGIPASVVFSVSFLAAAYGMITGALVALPHGYYAVRWLAEYHYRPWWGLLYVFGSIVGVIVPGCMAFRILLYFYRAYRYVDWDHPTVKAAAWRHLTGFAGVHFYLVFLAFTYGFPVREVLIWIPLGISLATLGWALLLSRTVRGLVFPKPKKRVVVSAAIRRTVLIEALLLASLAKRLTSLAR